MAKTEKLTIKVLATQKQALEAMARTDGEAVAVIVRKLIRAEAQRRGLWPAKAEQPQEVRS